MNYDSSKLTWKSWVTQFPDSLEVQMAMKLSWLVRLQGILGGTLLLGLLQILIKIQPSLV